VPPRAQRGNLHGASTQALEPVTLPSFPFNPPPSVAAGQAPSLRNALIVAELKLALRARHAWYKCPNSAASDPTAVDPSYTFAISSSPSILFLCTGNLCRSVMAEAMMRARALSAGSGLRVESAGFTTAREHPPSQTIATMRDLGLDVSSHRSRTVTARLLEGADLVLCMERAHVWDAALLLPEALPRSFVIGELVRLNSLVSGRKPSERFSHWLERLHVARQEGVTRILAADEIPDPYRRRERAHQRVARRLDRLIRQLGDCAFDPAEQDHEARWLEGKLVWHPTAQNPLADDS
jgi:low molecular weight protein-tyrosine phosphatase